MPRYEYECFYCGQRVVRQLSIDDYQQEFDGEADCYKREERGLPHRFIRIWNTFGGRFGDTPRHHR